MARPLKKGVDYFPLDCIMSDDVRLVEAEFGITGFAVVIKLWQKIYGSHGYYCEWSEEVALLFAKDCGLSGNVVSEIIAASVRRGVFDGKIFKEYGVLTSVDIQECYLDITKRRQDSEIDPRYALVKCVKNGVNVDNNSDNACNNDEKAISNTQSKIGGKQSNKSPSIARESAEEERGEVQAYGRFGNVRLTPEEYEKLQKEIPNAGDFIDLFSARCASKGYSYENDYAALLSWYLEEKTKQGAPAPAKGSPRKQTKQPQASPPSYGDIDAFFAAALRRTYGKEGGVT